MRTRQACVALVAAAALAACTSVSAPPPDPMQKVLIDLGKVDALGLVGPPDAQRPLIYEFCVPNELDKRVEVRDLDPTVRFVSGAAGRVGCTETQILAYGSTFGGHWRERLQALASLPYVEKIRKSEVQ